MSDYRKAYLSIVKCVKMLHKLKILENDKDGNPKIPTGLIGLAGEFYITWLLQTKNLDPKLCRGHYDIEIKNREGIEVRSSVLKFEGDLNKPKISNWGWRLQSRKEKDDEKGKKIPYKWVICVKFDYNLENPECFLLSKDDVKKMGKVKIHFWKVLKKLWIYKTIDDMKLAIKQNPKVIPSLERKINMNKKNYLFEKRWQELL